ncbi:MAG TPA: hypothetical protein VD884_14680 [Ohtaekwangia sp.]|nr:hypothetical protein [Ohtaekwangia sp.]
MRKNSLILSFLLSICISLSAQTNLIEFNEVTFFSPFEKKILTDHFINKNTDEFLLFMAGGSLLSDDKIEQAKKRFYSHIEAYQAEKIAGRKNDKRAKHIYDDIHKTFLKKYEEGKSFEDIFFNGSFNSLSASALYALAFHEGNIPYTIKEEPTHVYLVAFPENERIKVEAKSPHDGFQSMTTAFKQQFVKSLKDQKVISPQEFASYSQDQLFDRFYFGNQQDITLLNLVGIQYMNDATIKYEERKFDESLAQFEKAYLFFPSPKTSFLLMSACHEAFAARKEKDTAHAHLLAKLARFSDYGISSDIILGEFSGVIQTLLFEKGQKEALEQYYKVLLHKLTNPALKKEVEFLYYYESGRLLYIQSRHAQALPLFEAALKLKPTQLDVNTAFIGVLAQTLSATGDNLEIMNQLEKYAQQYPTLLDNNTFNNMRASTYLAQFGIEYQFGKASTGDKYKVLFEEYLKKIPGLPVNSNLIGQAYSTAAVYYFRKGQTAKARSLIEKGLELSPQNYELLMRQRMIK